MKAVTIDAYGGPEQLRLAEVPAPLPGPGEVLVRLAVAGINFIDIYMRKGIYRNSHVYGARLPMTLGMEGAGTVVTVGEGVGAFRPGDRVSWCIVRGSYAEFATVPADRLVAVPDGVPLEVAAALMLQGFTAHYLSHSLFPLQPGQTALVHAASGGVGQLLVQLARRRGARVAATVGSPEKAERALALGAERAILYREEDFLPAVREWTAGEGVHVVYDSVGRDTIARSLAALRRRGTCVLFGASSGPVPAIEPIQLAEAGSVFFTRPHLADYIATPDELRGRAGDLFAAWSAGRLTVAVDRELPLDAAAEAHRLMEERRTQGKLLLRIGG
ncbi:quinone oxidoreductase family protein [Azospirillum sp. ST 5-10]|uniref:quinone oxidoreductase family protein n=1 Tax=unclassified Azospirillum TaxID=2630922 RepID=UPI003F4A198B